MDTILIATDFSAASQSASFYGMRLAKALRARIVLLHVYPVVIPAADGAIFVTDNELKENAEEQLYNEIKWLDNKRIVNIETRCEQGNAIVAILSVAREINAKWIIAGMKGANETDRKFFGGTAYALSRHTAIPLILVPEACTFKPPKIMALASDIQDEEDLDVLQPLNDIGAGFSAEIYVLRIVKPAMDDIIERLSRLGRIKWKLKELHPTYECLNDNDVVHAVNDFVTTHHVDMIAMISKEHNLLERIFIKSNIKKMIVHTQIPLLILPASIHAKKTIEDKKRHENSNAAA